MSKKSKTAKKVERVYAKAMTSTEIDIVGMALARLIRTKAARKRFDLNQIIKMQSVVGDLIAFASAKRKRRANRRAKVSAVKLNGTGKNGPVRTKRPASLSGWECMELDCDTDTGKANRLFCAKHRGYGVDAG